MLVTVEKYGAKKYPVEFMSRTLNVSRQGYYKWLKTRNKPYKYAVLLAQIETVLKEDKENENYGTERMYDALVFKFNITVSQSTVARVMRENGLTHKKKHNPKGLTKADKEVRKSDDLLHRDFKSDEPNRKLVSDITQIPTADGPLYISGIFDCYDNVCAGLSMADNMRTELVIESLVQAAARHNIKNAIFHTDRGSQYTSHDFRVVLNGLGLNQSMNSAGGRCHDNAKCESMWARLKVEMLYRTDTSELPMERVKSLVFRYFMGYWNNRRICHAIGGLPPMMKRAQFFESHKQSGTAA